MDGLTLETSLSMEKRLKQIEKLVETKFNNGRLDFFLEHIEAKEAGIPVKYERNFFKKIKEILNAIFDNEKRIAEIIIDTPGLGKNAYNNIDSGSLEKPHRRNKQYYNVILPKNEIRYTIKKASWRYDKV